MKVRRNGGGQWAWMGMGLCNLFPPSAVPARQPQLRTSRLCNWFVLFEASFQASAPVSVQPALLMHPRESS
jgi:hypothetical protein